MPETPTFGRRQPKAFAPPARSGRVPSLAELGVAPADADAQELEAWRQAQREKRRRAYLRQFTGLRGVGFGLLLCSVILKLADLNVLSLIPGTLAPIFMFVGWRRNRAAD
ncbi:MAG: hypothetical protein V4514_00290 [Pseudomonadota bacterium]|uniref:hypothetical protein n=1 Tax=unclassified Phenylobacterium TaxID=2640670 RepID=UPI0006F57940|nr:MULTISPECIES: hypothetical protein [unclassified Phenylobacterium]KRB44707.1 hypothetical protein ASE02_03525 [Phenylobacterium sp. Root700]MBT9472211.1 hypothetical protein [Phenylobacterium sp.]